MMSSAKASVVGAQEAGDAHDVGDARDAGEASVAVGVVEPEAEAGGVLGAEDAATVGRIVEDFSVGDQSFAEVGRALAAASLSGLAVRSSAELSRLCSAPSR
jgi:hypothetical protein